MRCLQSAATAINEPIEVNEQEFHEIISESIVPVLVDFYEIRTRSSHYFVAQVAYSYEFREEYYSGRYLKRFPSEDQAWEYADRLRGTKATVRVDPAKPDDSLIENEDAQHI